MSKKAKKRVRSATVTFEWWGTGSQDQQALDIVSDAIERTLDALDEVGIVDASMSAKADCDAKWYP